MTHSTGEKNASSYGASMINVIIVLAVVAAVLISARRYLQALRRGGCGCGCSGGGESHVARLTVADTNEAHYPHVAGLTVEGMRCEHCLAAVESALAEAVESAGYRVVG